MYSPFYCVLFGPKPYFPLRINNTTTLKKVIIQKESCTSNVGITTFGPGVWGVNWTERLNYKFQHSLILKEKVFAIPFG